MFTSWREYRDHLLEDLIEVESVRKRFRHKFVLWDKRFRIEDPAIDLALVKAEITSILVNDFEWTKVNNFAAANPSYARGWRSREGQGMRSK
jgi:hypothetical protein